jgi:copper homeostasis protein
MSTSNYHIEAVATSVASAVAAQEGGASRIELCSALSLGGITPSAGLIAEVCRAVSIPVHVLIRPREGDFCFSEYDITTMQRDISLALHAGARGIVTGALTPSATVDTPAMQRLIAEAGEAHVVFHRAFDVCAGQGSALKEIAELGCLTLLTSGGAPSAAQGAVNLHALALQAPESLQIMAGAGIRPSNLSQVFHPSIHWYHMSASMPVTSAHSNALFDVSRNEVDRTIVRQVRNWLDQRASLQ